MVVYIKNIFALIFGLIGMVIVISSIFDAYLANASKEWKNTVGKMTEAQMVASGSNGLSKARVLYEYYVDGVQYENTKIRFVGFAPNRKLQYRYRAGKKVKIYYNPLNPNRSVLEFGGSMDLFISFIMGVIFLLFGGFVYILRIE